MAATSKHELTPDFHFYLSQSLAILMGIISGVSTKHCVVKEIIDC